MSAASAAVSLEHVGLVGFGIMGAAIAPKLLAAGHAVTVFDANPDAMVRAVELGCTSVSTAAEVARRARVILISLPRPEHVDAVVRLGDDNLLDGATAGTVIVDTSTVDPATSERNAAAARKLGIGYLDCPVLGRPSGAGSWTLPTGGDAADVTTAMPVLKTFAASVVHLGPTGAGNRLKLLNNLMFGVINSATAEMFALASQLGVEPRVAYDTIVDSGAGTVSNLFRELGPKVVEGDFSAAFSVDNLEKDVGLGLAMARDAGISLEVSEAGQRLNQRAQAAGYGSEDSAAVTKVVAESDAEADRS